MNSEDNAVTSPPAERVNQDHPDIPPRSKFFLRTTGQASPEWVYLRHGVPGDVEMCRLTNVFGPAREEIAAVAEIGWIRRAERWNRLCKKQLKRWLLSEVDTVDPRGIRYQDEVRKCRMYGRQWREWGEAR